MIPRLLPSRASTGLFLVLLPLLLASSGCASADRVVAHERWPTECAGRALYRERGEDILVYATGAPEASSVAKLVERAADDFRELTGEEPRTVVPIVIGLGETIPLEPGSDPLVWLREHALGTSDMEFNLEVDSDDEGAGASLVALIAPIFFPMRALDSPNAELWAETPAVFLPTNSMRGRLVGRILDEKMAEADFSTMKRILLKPVLVVVREVLESKMEDMARGALVFWQLQLREPAYSPEELKGYMRAYEEKLGLRDPPEFDGALEGREIEG